MPSHPSSPAPQTAFGHAGDADPGIGVLGLVIFIVALAVLFASCIVGLLIVHQDPALWLPRRTPLMLAGLLVATLALLGCGVLLQRALTRVRRGAVADISGLLQAAFVLGCAFLLLQGWNWTQVLLAAGEVRVAGGAVANAFFYVLTALHAAHVLAGLPPLWIVAVRGRRGSYTPAEHRGLLYCTMYWHFLDGVWLTTIAVILLVT